MSSGAGSGFYDFSLFYRSDELADVTLQLVAPVEEHLVLANQAGCLSLALINEQMEDLPAHGVVLAACSPYFLAELTRWRQRAASRDSSELPATRPVITLRVDSTAEAEAARALVQFMYKQHLPEDAPQPLLIGMLRLADKFDVQQCAAACADTLSKAELAWDTVVQLLSLPAVFWDSQLTSSLLSKAKDQLQEQLGDLEVVLNTAELHERFLSLPPEVVEVLLDDKRTRVRFENTVLAAATLWMDKHGDGLIASNKKRLAGLIRLPQCTPLFAAGVLPALPWLVEALGTPILMASLAVGRFAESAVRAEPSFTLANTTLLSTWPTSWKLGKRPLSSRQALGIEWSLPVKVLEQLSRDKISRNSPTVVFGGLRWSIQVECSSKGELGMFAKSTLLVPAAAVPAPVSLLAGTLVCKQPVQGNVQGNDLVRTFTVGGLFNGSSGWGWCDFWGAGAMAAWQPQHFAKWVDATGHINLQLNIEEFM